MFRFSACRSNLTLALPKIGIASRLVYNEEVRDAVNTGKPVVALESTLITHGLPHPNNLETARLLELTVRSRGAVPATIALFDGHIAVGLTDSELQRIADPAEFSSKVSVRDLSNVLVRRLVGGTTVASTMRIAHAAGIRVFSTGGIGGVHRGAENTFDVSADLIELGRTPVAVVCAGAKSILDIQKTLEFLETHSTNVIVYGKNRNFPGFFVPKTPYLAPWNFDNIDEIAHVLLTSDELNLAQGTLIACPLPAQFAPEGEVIEIYIQQALDECRFQNIASRDVTPFVLRRVNELSKGWSMKTNISLLQNNAKIAADIAKSYQKAKKFKVKAETVATAWKPVSKTTSNVLSSSQPKVVCIGASIVDFEVLTDENVKNDGGSYKGAIFQRCGGVARNHADALGRLGCHSTLLTALGSDHLAEYLQNKAKHYNILNPAVAVNVSSPTYMSVNIKGTMVHGFSAIEQAIAAITPEYVKSQADIIADADYIIADGNLSPKTLHTLVSIAHETGQKVWFEPTDIAKASKILYADSHLKIAAMSPNINEAAELVKALGHKLTPLAEFEHHFNRLHDQAAVSTFLHNTNEVQMGFALFKDNPHFETLFITLGHLGSIGMHKDSRGKLSCFPLLCPSIKAESIVSVSGAGDCFNAGFLAAYLRGQDCYNSALTGLQCAKLSLASINAVPENLSWEFVQAIVDKPRKCSRQG